MIRPLRPTLSTSMTRNVKHSFLSTRRFTTEFRRAKSVSSDRAVRHKRDSGWCAGPGEKNACSLYQLGTRDMEPYDIQPVLASALPDVASFLRRWKTNRDEESSIASAVREDALTIERCLRWLLLENPLAAGVSHYGFCIRDSSGHI